MESVDGKRTIYRFENRSDLLIFLSTHVPTDDDEILLILWAGTCIYSQLGSSPITWEDVSGFFA
jgi:hypothetical protein